MSALDGCHPARPLRTRRRTRAWATVTWAVAMLCALAGLVLGLFAGAAPDAVNPTPRGIVILFSICFALSASVGAVIVRRAAGHPVGVLVLLAGTAYAAGLAAEGYAKLRAADGRLDLGTALASWLDLTSWRLAAVLLAIALALFPERRPDSLFIPWLLISACCRRRCRRRSDRVHPGAAGCRHLPGQPARAGRLADGIAAVGPPAETLSWVLTALAVGSVVWRYLRAPSGSRRQLRWPALAAALLLVGLRSPAGVRRRDRPAGGAVPDQRRRAAGRDGGGDLA